MGRKSEVLVEKIKGRDKFIQKCSLKKAQELIKKDVYNRDQSKFNLYYCISEFEIRKSVKEGDKVIISQQYFDGEGESRNSEDVFLNKEHIKFIKNLERYLR